ncbi:MAG: ABC transporter ATP-binding protein [Gemmatimonadota bacterium]|nr:ABC transporter ATP-binding protein [Gemmatimonadota bacterium]
MSEPVVRIDGFSYAFGVKRVLRNVSLQICRGEYLSVIGPNGAGKSTLLRCLIRILRGGEGEIALSGRPLPDYSQKELARLISYVPQAGHSSWPFTVEEFVLMGRYPYLSPFTTFREQDKHLVHEALAMTGTANLAGRRMNALSGGERQIVCIASAIAQGAELMLLDEPTAFLDPRHESDILSIIAKVNRDFGSTIVSVTHDINNAALQSERVVSLKDGEVMFDGPAGEIMDNEVLESIYNKKFSFARHPDTGRLIILPEAGAR